MPRVFVGRCTPTRLASYAIALNDYGNRVLGTWCWNRALKDSTLDERTLETMLDLCFDAGHYETAAELTDRSYEFAGLMPGSAIRHVGMFLLSDQIEAALGIYDRLLEKYGDELLHQSPSPVLFRATTARELRSKLADGTKGNRVDSPGLELEFARLCFSFGAFDASAGLFNRAYGKRRRLEAEDEVGYAYSLLRSRGTGHLHEVAGPALCPPSSHLKLSPRWHMHAATALFAQGFLKPAASLIETILRSKFAGHRDLDQIVDDCCAIFDSLARCPVAMDLDDDLDAAPAGGHDEGLPKVFICGHGWSGSGAVYDALMDLDRFSEPPKAGPDRYLNADTDTEMMFVQGAYGVGQIWRRARQSKKLTQLDLWDLVRCHVIGEGAVGYSEHKSANAASNLVEQLGGRYTRVFRRLYWDIATTRASASLGALRDVLRSATESVSSSLTEGTHDKIIIFNNAIFGRNVDMLEILTNFKAIVVSRDPRDQYADRKTQDIKHWMTPQRFVAFYRESQNDSHTRRQRLAPTQSQIIRDVKFERFVLEDHYRQDVIEWVLGGRPTSRVRQNFDPGQSARNIGIHERALSEQERAIIEKQLMGFRHHRAGAAS